jgi:hypothetical protein
MLIASGSDRWPRRLIPGGRVHGAPPPSGSPALRNVTRALPAGCGLRRLAPQFLPFKASAVFLLLFEVGCTC